MTFNYRMIAVAIFLMFIITTTSFSQERPKYLTVTTVHSNLDKENGSEADWLAHEKDYFEKVTMKNEFILSTTVLAHYFTADNTEMKMITGYSSWENIMKAGARTTELEKAAWPNEAEREKLMKEQSSYYTDMHSDEIYSILESVKQPPAKFIKPMVYYVRRSHTAWPENGSTEEISGMMKEFVENVINKNNYILAYYTNRHAWGSDSRDMNEAFVVETLCDVELALEENQKLIAAHWPDEAKRKAFFQKMGRYTTGFHGDYIFQSIPELSK